MTGERFGGRHAFVTGAGSGIGEAVARALHAEGARVTLADITDAASTVATELGGSAGAVRLDVRDEAQVRAALVDPVDILVNVAGIGSTTNAPGTTLEVWEQVFAVNARGTFLTCKHAIPGMTARGGGSIVNVASVGALVGLKNRAAYCASKGAVVAFTRALAIDHVADGIRVNAVCPAPWTRRGCGDSSRKPENRWRASAPASRWAVSASLARSPSRSSTSLRTRRRSSPAPPWSSTAG